MQQAYHLEVESSAEDAETMDAWTATFEELEPQRQSTAPMKQPERIGPSRVMIVDQADLRDLGNAEVERQVPYRLCDLIATATEEPVVDGI